MVKTNVKIVRDYEGIAKRPHISENGEEYLQVIPSSKPKGREYEIKEDSVHLFSDGQIISESEYNSVRKNYDIRMKYWDGNSEHRGKGVSHISGQKRELIKDFLDKRKSGRSLPLKRTF